MEELSRPNSGSVAVPGGYDEQEAQKGMYMTFKSGNEYYGIKIQYVNEIIGFQDITPVPETESYIMGLINLRGKIIPVIDVQKRFGQEPSEYNDRTCIIVVDVKATTVGLIVEKIAEAVEIKDENILPPPTISRVDRIQNKYVYGIAKVGDSVKLLLDPERLLGDEEQQMTEQTNELMVEN